MEIKQSFVTHKPLQIAIDGPVGSGKGTLAVALAKNLHAMHIYTGGMWRALTLACLRQKIDIYNEGNVLDALKNNNIDLRIDTDSPLTKVFLNGEDVTNEIFFPEVSNSTPIVAAYRSVRELMAQKQKEIANEKKGVVEGRDVATHILPNADLKIYLTADVDVRAKRRLHQLKEKNVDLTFEEVRDDVLNRDNADSSREYAPLTVSRDSFIVDTSNDSIDDTVQKVLAELTRRKLV